LSANEFKKGSYDNSFWLKSVLGHEADPNNGHKSESLNLKHNYTYMAHAGVYFEQGRTSVFAKLDENGKYTVASAFTDRIWNAFVNGEIKSEQIKTYINAFNTKNTGGVTINAGLITIGNNISGMRFNISVGEKQSPNESAKTLKNPHQ
jgi:hypothetical protein